MLTYTVDFLSRSVIDTPPAAEKSVCQNRDISAETLFSNGVDRSTGSPDSLRSESSDGSSHSTSNNILTLEMKAEMVTNGCKTDKPPHSYIALISMAILSSKENKTVLGDIYKFIMNKFPYYNNEDKAWRNSIRYNLSINECFIKNGRPENGKGNFWSIHPACVADFIKGDFRRRQARKRVRKNVKDVNKSCHVNGIQHNPVYTPMTSSSAGYHPKTPIPLMYQPETPSPVGYQPMTSTPIGTCSFPFVSIMPGYHPTPSVSQGYFAYQENYRQTRTDNTSPTTSYASPIQLLPSGGRPFISPYMMQTNVETLSCIEA